MPREPTPFWSRVNKEGGRWFNGTQCWEWTGRDVNQWGHGRYKLPGNGRIGAHRYAYEQLVGPIPMGMVLDHLCDNPPCVNPAHLQPTTQRGNLVRSPRTLSGVNARKTHCIHGHPFDEANTYWQRGRRGRLERYCRACHAARELARQRRRKGQG